jgi:hypothetical protein
LSEGSDAGATPGGGRTLGAYELVGQIGHAYMAREQAMAQDVGL